MSQTGTRLLRLVRIVSALAIRPRRRSELGELFGVSERTIQDDIRVLREAGLVTHTRDGYALAGQPGSAHVHPLAPGYAVRVGQGTAELVFLRPRGTVSWVEEPVSPQPPLDLLRPYLLERGSPRGLYALTPELATWLSRR